MGEPHLHLDATGPHICEEPLGDFPCRHVRTIMAEHGHGVQMVVPRLHSLLNHSQCVSRAIVDPPAGHAGRLVLRYGAAAAALADKGVALGHTPHRSPHSPQCPSHSLPNPSRSSISRSSRAMASCRGTRRGCR